MIKEKLVKEVPNLIQNEKSKSPFVELEIMAKMINTAVSVSMVPPTAMATAGCFDKPNLLIMGYATRVCVANMLAVNKLAVGLNFKPQ